MTVCLDGSPLQQSFGSELTLQQIVDAVRPQLSPDTLVVSIAFDDRTLLESELVHALQTGVPRETRVDLVTGDRFEITASALREISAHLNDATETLPGIADLLTAGQVATAMQRLGDCLQIWNQCQAAVGQSSRLVGFDLAAMTVDGRPIMAFMDDLIAKLREIRDAFTAGDMVLLADVLRYEMPETCANWQHVLDILAERVLQRAA